MKKIIHKIKNDRVLNKINQKLDSLSCISNTNSNWWFDYSTEEGIRIFSVSTYIEEIYLYKGILILFGHDDINIVKECIIGKFNYIDYTFDTEII